MLSSELKLRILRGLGGTIVIDKSLPLASFRSSESLSTAGGVLGIGVMFGDGIGEGGGVSGITVMSCWGVGGVSGLSATPSRGGVSGKSVEKKKIHVLTHHNSKILLKFTFTLICTVFVQIVFTC